MTKQELLERELDLVYEKGFPQRYFDKDYITSNTTVAFVSFLNDIIESWVQVLADYNGYNMDHLYTILRLSPGWALEICGGTVNYKQKLCGKAYLEQVKKIIMGVYVTGEMIRSDGFDDEVTFYNIHRKMT